MKDNFNFETYLFFSKKKITISIITDLNKILYNQEYIIKDNINRLDLRELDIFLNKNIYKIEKKISGFINEIILILDLDIFFPLEISIKNNYGNLPSLKTLNYLLQDAKDCCRETIGNKKIIHMIIDNYQIDNKSYSSLPENTKCDSFSLDIKFICLANNLIKDLEKILKKYHISINQILNSSYVEKFLTNNENNIFLVAKNLKKGLNPNEVLFEDKKIKNEGFFEKFFNFFN